MTAAAEIDLDLVDRDFDVAVRSQNDADEDAALGLLPPRSPADALPAHAPGLGTVATAIVLCAGLAGTAACVLSFAVALHTVIERAWSIGHPDVAYDLLCAGAWLCAGGAAILTAIGVRRHAASAQHGSGTTDKD